MSGQDTSTAGVARRIDYVRLADVVEAEANPKRHDLDAIRRSVERYGFVTPGLVDERTGRLIAGHGRIRVLRAMHAAGESPPEGVRLDVDGEWLVPVVAGWASRSDAEADAYLVIDNHHPSLGGWDNDALSELLHGIEDPDLLGIVGVDLDALDALLGDQAEPDDGAGEGGGDDGPAGPPRTPITVPGDLWLLGPHRIVCGDSRDYDVVARLLDGRTVDVAITSPPYASQRKYDESSGFVPIRPDEYVDWFADVQANVRAHLAPTGSWFVNIKEHAEDGQRHLYVKDLTVAHVRRWGWRFVDELVWVHGGLPGTWDNRHKNCFEPVFHYSAERHIKFRPLANGIPSDDAFTYSGELEAASTGNPISWSGSDVDRTSGMALPGNVLRIAKSRENVQHEAVYPVALPGWFIRAYSDEGDAVFDPFMGSGSTLIAAHQEGRVAYGCEISTGYCDEVCARWQRVTGVLPLRLRPDGSTEPVDFAGGGDG